MCNRILRLDTEGRKVQPIPEKGVGWKIFGIGESSIGPRSLMYRDYYEISPDGWINWDESSSEGFCFFLNKEEAERCGKLWCSRMWNCVVRKIEYEKGIQERDEDKFISGETTRVALCHRFRIVEETEA